MTKIRLYNRPRRVFFFLKKEKRSESALSKRKLRRQAIGVRRAPTLQLGDSEKLHFSLLLRGSSLAFGKEQIKRNLLCSKSKAVFACYLVLGIRAKQTYVLAVSI